MSGLQSDSDNVLQTRVAFVADRMRESIKQGHFEPGQKLDQDEIARRLNVSRSPVREALRTLAAEGLVNVYPHRGAVVAELSLDELEEIFLIRASLEGLAARLSAAAIDDERLAKLEAVLEKLNASTDLEEWPQLNRQFHETIYQAVHRPHLLSLIQRLRNIASPYIRRYIVSEEHLETAHTGHQRIFEACTKRDAALAQKETEQHLKTVVAGALEFMKAEMSSPQDAE